MDKRICSILIPYREATAGILVFLQKRAKDAVRHPDDFGFFGGGMEPGESPEQALERETWEELSFKPTGYDFLGVYESAHTIRHVYSLKVENDFESKIQINEGQYGKFFTEQEYQSEPLITDKDKLILRDFYHLKRT
ncbi:MAG: NUDIX domain-containing protein [Patescibacteria group bacterium]|nr:NUDIX domain-containing protein [Patescibacteria group bacterium]